MADEVVELAAEVVGADEAVRDLNRVRGAAQQVERQGASQATAATSQARTIATAHQSIGGSATAAGARVGQLGTAFGGLAPILGTINPALGQMVSQIGATGSATTGLTGALGPLGLAVGAVTVATWAYSRSADAAAERLASQRRQVDALSESYGSIVGRIRAAAEEQDRMNRVMAGAGSNLENVGELTRAQNELRRMTAALEGNQAAIAELRATGRTGETRANAGAARGLEGALVRGAEAFGLAPRGASDVRLTAGEVGIVEGMIARQIGRVEQLASVTREGAESAIAATAVGAARNEASAATGSSGRGGGGVSEAQREAREVEQWIANWRASLDQMEQGAFRAANRSMLDDMAERGQESVRIEGQTQDAINELRQWGLDRDKDVAAARIAEAERVASRTKEIAQESASEMRELNSMLITDSLAPVTDLAGELFGFLVDGADLSGDAFLRMLDSFLESTAIQYTIKALAEGAEAAAAAARYDYGSAVQHGVAAALAGAVAIATGVAGAAISVPAAPTAGAGPNASPAPVQGQGQGGGNLTVNLFAPQAVFTEAERGELIAGAMREGRRQLGPGAVRG